MFTAEQVIASHKANVEALFGFTNTAFQGVEKLVELNLTAAKAAFTDAAAQTRAALAVKDVQELLALQAGMVQPLAEKSASYGRHVYEIAAGTGAELGKAIEGKSTQFQAALAGSIDNIAKNAPAGSESAVAVMKNAFAAANNAFESLQSAVKQASSVAESNFHNLAATAANVAKPAAKKR